MARPVVRQGEKYSARTIPPRKKAVSNRKEMRPGGRINGLFPRADHAEDVDDHGGAEHPLTGVSTEEVPLSQEMVDERDEKGRVHLAPQSVGSFLPGPWLAVPMETETAHGAAVSRPSARRCAPCSGGREKRLLLRRKI